MFKDEKCLSFVMKVNVKMSVRNSYHNCPKVRVRVRVRGARVSLMLSARVWARVRPT